ncbi:MAG: YbaB/EbfC family nucleoid-associated protein [Thermoanaerobacteraceae bacterium]|uniref:YbaB/EbfC family nucleoid-associated protein n=1 Tax=Thermanaeromonas sp. C210 TaxID=2731925 RepID=UPI00155CBA81|nr:YbaB/EbfC family nucleoid-associated protein [Thermanaeromonas sp. C210]MBE3580838.1 YbaB/EbfC family nucleoid-associated protein [Thermoanaerobacteraceae bacterium]GFN21687.1 nucleoid-associated protein [Thermanaeromonas sp. C210]
MNLGNMNKMMKQMQKMQSQLAKVQEELAERTVEATAGGGAVRVVVNGRQEIVSLAISPEAVDPEDVEMLQDLIVAAVNEGLRRSQEMVAGEMAKITGQFKLPGLF